MAADPQTWTELKAALAVWMVRDDLTTIIPEAIAYAEREFQRSLFCPERQTSATLTVTNGTASLPSDFWGVRTCYVDGTTDYQLDQVTPQRLRELGPTTDTDTPQWFAIEGETISFRPIPAAGTSIILSYWQTIPVLSGSNATNWLLTDHPDIYLHASLARLCAYTRDPEGMAMHNGIAAQIAETVNRSGRRRFTNSGPLVAAARTVA